MINACIAQPTLHRWAVSLARWLIRAHKASGSTRREARFVNTGGRCVMQPLGAIRRFSVKVLWRGEKCSTFCDTHTFHGLCTMRSSTCRAHTMSPRGFRCMPRLLTDRGNVQYVPRFRRDFLHAEPRSTVKSTDMPLKYISQLAKPMSSRMIALSITSFTLSFKIGSVSVRASRGEGRGGLKSP